MYFMQAVKQENIPIMYSSIKDLSITWRTLYISTWIHMDSEFNPILYNAFVRYVKIRNPMFFRQLADFKQDVAPGDSNYPFFEALPYLQQMRKQALEEYENS